MDTTDNSSDQVVLSQETQINQIPDVSPIDVNNLTLSERIERLEIASGITT